MSVHACNAEQAAAHARSRVHQDRHTHSRPDVPELVALIVDELLDFTGCALWVCGGVEGRQ